MYGESPVRHIDGHVRRADTTMHENMPDMYRARSPNGPENRPLIPDPCSHIKEPVLVSACLLGIACRYDGKSKYSITFTEDMNILPIPVCPEQLGGLPTPRAPSDLIGGDGRDVLEGKARLLNSEGVDVTENFIKGGRQTCNIARILNAKKAILKEDSPSCGVHMVKMSGKWTKGIGVAAAMLSNMGLKIVNEGEIESL
ncbi:MAG: DUF523 domain-containing protein [Thermodesulfobacteriota bacterium]|nr:DUF523 domain-containing protein [Thermodesulfobacteriota bacterium]